LLLIYCCDYISWSSKTGETLTKGKTAMSTQTAKLVARIAENLPDMSTAQMQGWIENPKRLKQVLSVLAEVPSDPKAWKRITLGTGIKDADGFRKAINDSGMRVGDWANDILGKTAFSVATKKKDVDLVVVSVEELGFKDGARLKDIYAAAKKRGLELCPNEVGPELRLQYEDQSKGEWVIIGMEPITDSDGALSLFSVEHDGNGLWLYTDYDSPDYIWNGDDRFVFVLPRK